MGGPRYPKVIGYELVQQIGGGGFSTVFRAVNIEHHRVAACKIIMLTEETTEKDRKNVEKEMRIHTALKHPNVLEFLNAVIVEMKHKHVYVPGIYMLLELAAGGDLFDKIAPDIGVGEDIAHIYFNQLVSGMAYIHSQGVCHRDLKPENLLLDGASTLKISDFGLSAVFRLKESGKTRALTERCGSLPYVAPELSVEGAYHAEPVDVWGVGVILYTMLVGNTPWDEPTQASHEFRRYVDGTIFREQPWSRISRSALSLIRGMLAVDPSERFTLDDVVQHPWCIRPSQLEDQTPLALADLLTSGIKANGDMDLAAPPILNGDAMDTDEDEDTVMQDAHLSQFTQSLMLFSQTQSGSRYTPHLTRFYASLGPSLLVGLVEESLNNLGVRVKPVPRSCDRDDDQTIVSSESGRLNDNEPYRLRVGGWDSRRVVFKGWIEIERFTYRDGAMQGSFCVMKRDEGNPMSWRALWKRLLESELVEPHVLKKKRR
ncbi:hypothetical protein D9619_008540 [Psilocybe cf. subviscida]|uniref:Protein kinase domain-containing protein n=1 Tax=Psilocybe cf. subviscida TaxID=2480587 RepID=A0A8H5BA02_9AGAR|nr:hypothetical protein D9619_008540 [Psilocybe cf. subviscida]